MDCDKFKMYIMNPMVTTKIKKNVIAVKSALR